MSYQIRIFHIVAESPLPVPCRKFICEEMWRLSNKVVAATNILGSLATCAGMLHISKVTGESMKVPVLANWQFGWLADAVKLIILFSLPAAENSIYSSVVKVRKPDRWLADCLIGLLEAASADESRSEKNYKDVLSAVETILSKKSVESIVPQELECRFGMAVQSFVSWLSIRTSDRSTIWSMFRDILAENNGQPISPLCALFIRQFAHKCVAITDAAELCNIFLGNVPPTKAVPPS